LVGVFFPPFLEVSRPPASGIVSLFPFNHGIQPRTSPGPCTFSHCPPFLDPFSPSVYTVPPPISRGVSYPPPMNRRCPFMLTVSQLAVFLRLAPDNVSLAIAWYVSHDGFTFFYLTVRHLKYNVDRPSPPSLHFPFNPLKSTPRPSRWFSPFLGSSPPAPQFPIVFIYSSLLFDPFPFFFVSLGFPRLFSFLSLFPLSSSLNTLKGARIQHDRKPTLFFSNLLSNRPLLNPANQIWSLFCLVSGGSTTLGPILQSQAPYLSPFYGMILSSFLDPAFSPGPKAFLTKLDQQALPPMMMRSAQLARELCLWKATRTPSIGPPLSKHVYSRPPTCFSPPPD